MGDAKRTERLEADVDADLIGAVRDLARDEGRQVAALLDEALADLVAKRSTGQVRANVMKSYHDNVDRFDSLFKKLAE